MNTLTHIDAEDTACMADHGDKANIVREALAGKRVT